MWRIVISGGSFFLLTACSFNPGALDSSPRLGYAPTDDAAIYQQKPQSRKYAALDLPTSRDRTRARTAPLAREDELRPDQYQDLRDGKGRRKAAARRGRRVVDLAPRGTWDKAPKGAFNYKSYKGVALDPKLARDMINRYRASKGLKPLHLNARLTRAAMKHSRDLARFDRISHHGSDGTDPWDRVKKTGYRARLAAENVGTGQSGLAEVFKGWQDSPGHNANLLLKDAEQMGIALVYDPSTEYRTFWTLVLASPMNSPRR